jgi:hypothetical protein
MVSQLNEDVTQQGKISGSTQMFVILSLLGQLKSTATHLFFQAGGGGGNKSHDARSGEYGECVEMLNNNNRQRSTDF